MEAVHQLAPTVGIESACEVLGVARASFYRQPVFGPALPVASRPSPARALSKEERETVHIHAAITSAHPLPVASGNCPERFGRGSRRGPSRSIWPKVDSIPAIRL